MRHVPVLALLLALFACRESAPADGAVRVSVKYGSYKPACIRVSAKDMQGHGAETDILRSQFKKADQKEVTVAVYRRPEWGRELTVEVSVYDASSEERCSGTVVETHASRPITVPQGSIAPFEVTLRAKDDDQDGHILKREGVAGTDCDDARSDVRPGAAEACSEQVDFDCDGVKGCKDSDCQDKACDDGNACTLNERCGPNAQCVSTVTMQCNSPPSTACHESQGTCNPSTGQCEYVPRPANTPCNDNNPCTQNDRCGPTAQCAGSTVQCNSPPNTACYESTGQCDSTSGQCVYTRRASNVSCDDGNACTGNDKCDNSGQCAGTPLPPCTARDCYRPVQACAPSGSCMEEPDPTKVNTACSLGEDQGVCRADGVCSNFPYIPSNFNPDTGIPAASISNSLTTTCDVTFNSSTGVTERWNPTHCVSGAPTPVELSQGGSAPGVVVLAVRALNLGGHLRLVGDRPVILAVYGDATLHHAILANGDNTTPGAGGNQFCVARGGKKGIFSNGEGGGGGGGGNATAGAAGGQGSDPGASAGASGDQGGGVVPLLGGCPGGSGGASSTSGGAGGAGGGAFQLSVAGTLRVNQWVTVSGGAGQGGEATSTEAEGGGGGGSGGGLLLEAHSLEITSSARLTANGGGGGEGAKRPNEAGKPGENGNRSSAAPANGGQGGSLEGGNGGKGGALSSAPQVGSPGDPNSNNGAGGGGGGGGVGYIRLRSMTSCSIEGGSVVSPTPGMNCPP
jgi:hypothetical protein